MYFKWGVEMKSIEHFYSKEASDYVQQVVEQYQHIIDKFYVLFIFDELDEQYDYSTLYKKHMSAGSVISLEQNDVLSTSKSFVLSEKEYLQNEQLFYKLRLQARNRMIEKMAKSAIFYVVAQGDEETQVILKNTELLDEALEKTKRIIRKSTFISDPITWDYFYRWCRDQLKAYVFEEIVMLHGVNGIKKLTAVELNELFFEILTNNLSSDKVFIQKFASAVDLYIHEWQRKLIHELNNNIPTYLRIEDVVNNKPAKPGKRDYLQMTTVPHYILVLNSVAYHTVREAIYRKSFTEADKDKWPKYHFIKGNTKGHVQIIPKLENDKNTMDLNEDSLRKARMIAEQLSTVDVDVLDILCSVFLHKAKHPDEIIEFDLADILVMRGLQPKLGGEGRRGGFEVKQKEQIIMSLSNIQSLWLTIEKTVLYQNNRPVQVGIQGRTFLFKGQDGKEYVVNKETCSKTISFTMDKVFAKYLTSSRRQVALLPIKALRYHAYRFSLEKKLCRYLSWRWRTQAYKGDFLKLNKISTLLEASGEKINERSPMRTRERFEKALDRLVEDHIIAAWHYTNWDESLAYGKGWTKFWLNTSIIIEPQNIVLEQYRSIKKVQKGEGQLETVTKKQAENRKLGERLLEIRKKYKLTLLNVAEQLNVSASYVNNIERNQATPSSKLKQKLIMWMQEYE